MRSTTTMPRRIHLLLSGAVAITMAAACGSLVTDPGSDGSDPSQTNRPTYTSLQVAANKRFGPGNLAGARLAVTGSAAKPVTGLLELTPGPWSLDSGGSGTTPDLYVVGGNGPCTRDQYVAAALLEAYGVEAEARTGNTSADASYASAMTDNLRSAYALCSNSPSVGAGSCATLRFVSCDDLRALLSA